MIEVIIDRWTKDGQTEFLWSIWQDGRRVVQGDVYATGEAADAAARAACRAELGCEPDQVTHL